MGFTEKFDFKELCKKNKIQRDKLAKGDGKEGGGGLDNFLIFEWLDKKEGGLVFLRVG